MIFIFLRIQAKERQRVITLCNIESLSITEAYP